MLLGFEPLMVKIRSYVGRDNTAKSWWLVVIYRGRGFFSFFVGQQVCFIKMGLGNLYLRFFFVRQHENGSLKALPRRPIFNSSVFKIYLSSHGNQVHNQTWYNSGIKI